MGDFGELNLVVTKKIVNTTQDMCGKTTSHSRVNDSLSFGGTTSYCYLVIIIRELHLYDDSSRAEGFRPVCVCVCVCGW